MIKLRVLNQEMELAYREIAANKIREQEAEEWSDELMGDIELPRISR